MTREDAIEELKILKEEYWDDDGYGHETKQYDDTMFALDMAIKALEQEPCEDCVSRKSLLDKLDPLYKEKIKTAPDNMAEGFLQVSNLIKNESPVTPTRKKGKWIDFDLVDKYGFKEYKCSNCKDSVYEKERNIKYHKYCLHCGAEMESENV